MKHTVGAITIGQSPRTDVIPEIQHIAGQNVDFIEIGALDDLTLPEVESYAPQANDYVLHTRMNDGTAVTIGKQYILPRIQTCIDTLIRRGVELIVLLCTGKFPEFHSSALLIEPQKITDSLILALAGKQHKVGIMTPLAEQVDQAKTHLTAVQEHVVVVHASPYTSVDEIIPAAKTLKTEGVDLSVLHCIGYSLGMKKVVRDITGKPVILARSLTARVLQELLL
jgi:protein AroM